jgi:hypothetical protein
VARGTVMRSAPWAVYEVTLHTLEFYQLNERVFTLLLLLVLVNNNIEDQKTGQETLSSSLLIILFCLCLL